MKQLVPVIVPGTERVLMEAIPSDGRGNNDFCVEQDKNGLWHIFSITWYRASDTTQPRAWLSHATAASFLGPWERQPYILLSPSNNWAPHIVQDLKNPDKFLMYLGGMPKDTLRIYEANADDFFHWTLKKDLGKIYGSRDPMILYVEEEKLYYMYTTFTTEENANVGIAVSTSEDLENWKFVRIIRAVPGDNLDESPFVIKHNDCYYLWATASSRMFYQGIPTRVFRSIHPDFREIETTEKKNCIAEFPVHAVEIVNFNGKTYLCQTGTGGPGIVANELCWSEEGEQVTVLPQELSFQGEWSNDTQDWYSCIPGSSFSFRFVGRRIEIRGSKRMNAGIAEIFIDGKSCGKFSQYACDGETFQEIFHDAFLWTSDELQPTEHKLEVVVTGQKDLLSEDCFVNVNRIIVTQ